jgi:hypothetical protein
MKSFEEFRDDMYESYLFELRQTTLRIDNDRSTVRKTVGGLLQRTVNDTSRRNLN